MPKADRPTTSDNLQYHTHTGQGDLSPFCLIVGAQGRAKIIAKQFLKKPKKFENKHRGLLSYTGKYKGHPVSVTTSGMGGASTGIVLPEAVRSGARLFIRVGSCGSLIEESKIGDFIIPTAAIRYDGASNNWAPPEYPAFADHRVIAALAKAADNVWPGGYKLGVECTTDCFNAGQGRPDIWGEIPERMRHRHEEVVRLGAACYSMEAATLFTWCSTVGRGMPAGVVNAVFANRITNEFGTKGEEKGVEIALDALVILASDRALCDELSRKEIPYQI